MDSAWQILEQLSPDEVQPMKTVMRLRSDLERANHIGLGVGTAVIWDDDGAKHKGVITESWYEPRRRTQMYIGTFGRSASSQFTRNFDDESLCYDLKIDSAGTKKHLVREARAHAATLGIELPYLTLF